MQQCGPDLLTVLESRDTDLLEGDLFEFYAPDETDLCPANAEKRFAATGVVWLGWSYEQQAISRGDISRFVTAQSNTVNVTLSNIDRTVGTWLSTTNIEGYRVLIRCISRSVGDDSIVLGVFRCEKPDAISNTTVSIPAKQDLGSIENDLPWNYNRPKCPLPFKGVECLAGVPLGSHTATYQAADSCNKSWQQCNLYGNTLAFQGVRFTAVSGNFKVSSARGGAGGAVLSLLGLGNKRVTRQYSSQEGSGIGQAVTLGLGRTNVELIPLQYADTGQYLAGQWQVGEGEETALLNVHNITAGWATSFQAYAQHLGKYGYETSQQPVGFFTSGGDAHSHRGWVEATILGQNPDTGDPAPTLAATVLWLKIPTWTGSAFANIEWSDDPIAHTRFLLTEPRSLNYNEAWIDDEIAGQESEYCAEPMIDQTGGEDFYASLSSGTPGTDYKRYRSTGILDTHYFRKVLGLTSTYSAEREVTYNTYNPASPPTPTPGTYYRKRYTSNVHIRERTRAIDFIYKTLLPGFRGYFITSSRGKLQIKVEKPVITSYLLDAASAGTATLYIEDAYAWKRLNLPVLFVLVGVDEATSETARVSSVQYTTDGNSITLTASGSATASGATFSGGTTSVQAFATVTIGSAASATVTIDGHAIAYTANGDDTAGTVAAMVATKINADLTLNRYVQAIWTPTNPSIITLRSKLGTLTLASNLTESHDALELCAHIALPISDAAFGANASGNIVKDSHSWPLGSKQTSYNQFKLSYNDAVQDYQPTELIENDEEHQAKVNKEVPLEISGAAVDNYHQANRLVLGARYKYRQGDFFTQSKLKGLALLLEEGDVLATKHNNMPGKRNLLIRIEELRINPQHDVAITCRLYADDQFPTTAEERTIGLGQGVGWPSTVPDAVTSLTLQIITPGTITGSFDFAEYIGSQKAKIYIKLPGAADYVDTGLRIEPDADNEGAFSYSGVPDGITYIKVIPYSIAGDGPETIGSVNSGIISLDVLEYIVNERADAQLELEVQVNS